MGLMKKFLGKGSGSAKAKDVPQPSAFDEGEGDGEGETSLEQTKSRNAPHRDLVQLTLRDTMRRHGIPSDWIDCRTLSVLTKQHKSGMHVQFLVRKADYQVLPWLHALQEHFWEQILRADPKAHDWLFSVGWEFYGKSQQGYELMPGAGAWKQDADTQSPESERMGGDTLPPEEEEDLAMDLQKLQAMMTMPAPLDAVPEKPKGKR